MARAPPLGRGLFTYQPFGATIPFLADGNHHGTRLAFCFAASYALSLALDCLAMWQKLPLFKKWPQLPGWFRGGAWIMAAAGLVAHSLYLWTWQPSIAWQFGWLLVVAWFLTAFSVYEQAHRGRVSWSIFLLPMVLGMVGMATIIGPPPPKKVGYRICSPWPT